MKTCSICHKQTPDDVFHRWARISGWQYGTKCNSCLYLTSRKSILTELECAANNFISGSEIWLIYGVVMSLGKADIRYRPPV